MRVAIGAGGAKILDWPGLATYVAEAERLGVDAVWTAEAWAHDALTPLGFIAAHTERIRLMTNVVQIGARSPAMLAMSAMTLHSMSGGRFVLGLGTSGPSVMEGWHGVPFRDPLQRTRETVEICRRVAAGEPLEFQGKFYRLPLTEEDGGTGEAALIRTDAPPVSHLPIHLAALGPRNLRLTGEIADGWVGTAFLPETAHVFFDPIREGAAAAGRRFSDIELAVGGYVWFTDDPEFAIEELRLHLALVMGAMGSERRNFYGESYRRQGWGEVVDRVRTLWARGEQDEALEQIPAELVLGTNLVGSPAEVAERLRRYREVGVTTFRATPYGATVSEKLDTLGQFMDVVRQVSAEPVSPTGSRSAEQSVGSGSHVG
ncbi:MAG TPA: LLM class flavin-dependent oxidoreductase [Natronosporangium sp.]|nr:LLM class flavin-dependent oxidoreductase [Natronosporangium sp.]